MQSKGTAAKVHRLEVTSARETVFARGFASLRSGYFEHNSLGAKGSTKNIDDVKVAANATLSFNLGRLFV